VCGGMQRCSDARWPKVNLKKHFVMEHALDGPLILSGVTRYKTDNTCFLNIKYSNLVNLTDI
jgi:hypothetical protein